MSDMLKYNGLSKAEVLMVLYNASKPMGLGLFIATPNKMTLEEAEGLLEIGTNFDYIKGRVMKIDLSDDNGFDPWLYDRDNGENAASRALSEYRKQKQLSGNVGKITAKVNQKTVTEEFVEDKKKSDNAPKTFKDVEGLSGKIRDLIGRYMMFVDCREYVEAMRGFSFVLSDILQYEEDNSKVDLQELYNETQAAYNNIVKVAKKYKFEEQLANLNNNNF